MKFSEFPEQPDSSEHGADHSKIRSYYPAGVRQTKDASACLFLFFLCRHISKESLCNGFYFVVINFIILKSFRTRLLAQRVRNTSTKLGKRTAKKNGHRSPKRWHWNTNWCVIKGKWHQMPKALLNVLRESNAFGMIGDIICSMFHLLFDFFFDKFILLNETFCNFTKSNLCFGKRLIFHFIGGERR